jgi:hypothetical protein
MAEAIRAKGVTVTTLSVDVPRSPTTDIAASRRDAAAMGASRAATFGSVERIGHLASIGHPAVRHVASIFAPSIGRIEPGGGIPSPPRERSTTSIRSCSVSRRTLLCRGDP